MTQLDAFIETLRSRESFEPGASLVVTRAPGRLDVMGGIADYSGSLVLQRPIAEATFVALQPDDEPVLAISSTGRPRVVVPLSGLAPGGEPISYAQARTLFGPGTAHHWAAYVVGIFVVLMRERDAAFSRGAQIVIDSSVPEGKGVSSSAALETATMQAVISAFGIVLEPLELALLCQRAENLVAGAPCGVMDQMTCVFGEKDSLLALLCQPAALQPPVRVPEDISLWGVDSGEHHAVGGSDYGAVRTGAFMGHRLLMEREGVPTDYLANISSTVFEREYLPGLPDEMSGEAFLAAYPGTLDTVTTVDPARTYRIRQPTAHPVYEHHRVNEFRRLLLAPPSDERVTRLGALMYESHASYSACGLGSRGTDLLVDLVRAEGSAGGLYGARITGGGSGGTVAVLGRRDASGTVARVVDRYAAITGHRPYVFAGSSDGVTAFGYRTLTL